MKREDWDAVLATNLTAAFALTQAVLQADDQAARRPDHLHQLGGRPERQRRPGELRGVEGGLIGFTKALAREVASRGITVNVVAPGLIETDMTRAITENARDDWASQIPLGAWARRTTSRRRCAFLRRTRRRILQGTCWPSTAGCTCTRVPTGTVMED